MVDRKAEPGRAIAFLQRAGCLLLPLLPARARLWEVGPVWNQEGMGVPPSVCLSLPPPRHVELLADPTLLLALKHPVTTRS